MLLILIIFLQGLPQTRIVLHLLTVLLNLAEVLVLGVNHIKVVALHPQGFTHPLVVQPWLPHQPILLVDCLKLLVG